MKIITLLCVCLLLSACAPINTLPTVKNCEYIKYERRELAINFQAHCHVSDTTVDQLHIPNY